MSTSGSSGAFLDVDGLRLHYHDIGSGPPVVLLHGAGPGATGWSNFGRNVPALSRHFRLLLVDQPGFGLSEPSADRKESPYRAFAASVLGLMDALSIPTVSFVGNSLGGGTALQFAMDYPSRVDRLVLMAPGGGALAVTSPGEIEQRVGRLLVAFLRDPTRDRMKDFMEHMACDRSRITDEIVDERARTACEPGAVAALRDFLEWARTTPKRDMELWREVDRIEHETLLIWGREDAVLPLDGSLLLLRRMKNARLHVVPNCGHWVQIERQAEFERMVTTFLRSDEST